MEQRHVPHGHRTKQKKEALESQHPLQGHALSPEDLTSQHPCQFPQQGAEDDHLSLGEIYSNHSTCVWISSELLTFLLLTFSD